MQKSSTAEMRRLPILIPHRSGCADFPLPVLHGRASLAEVQMTPSVTCKQRTTRGRTSALVTILASSATRCRFVDRFVRLNVSPVFPVNGSLRTAPRFPRSGPGKSSSPMSQVLLRCYDFPPRISGHLYLLRFRGPRDPPRFVFRNL